MADKFVMIGALPEVVVLDAGEEIVWYSVAGNLKVEFDPNRCPFSSNVFQAPANMQLRSGALRPGINPGSYRYKISLNDTVIAHGEVVLRAK